MLLTGKMGKMFGCLELINLKANLLMRLERDGVKMIAGETYLLTFPVPAQKILRKHGATMDGASSALKMCDAAARFHEFLSPSPLSSSSNVPLPLTQPL